MLVKDGDEVQPGDALTEGHLELIALFKLKGRDAVMRYMLKETLYIYASQGIKLNSKHVEVIIRQMFSRVYVKERGRHGSPAWRGGGKVPKKKKTPPPPQEVSNTPPPKPPPQKKLKKTPPPRSTEKKKTKKKKTYL